MTSFEQVLVLPDQDSCEEKLEKRKTGYQVITAKVVEKQ